MSESRLTVGNEFAAVTLEIDDDGNSPRLRITDLHTGRVVVLDALELASLTVATHRDLDRIVLGHERYQESREALLLEALENGVHPAHLS